ncbi:MAG: hypothetical protein H0Z38_03505 [Firmicutes bacterium]|nr:hypothetical protein [Bacillota bacterium]
MEAKEVLVIVLVFLFCISGSALAGEPVFGTALAGMGGAGVALTKDVYAAYWNPAGLARINKFSIAPNLAFFTDNPSQLTKWTDYFQGGDQPGEGLKAAAGGIVGFATPRFAINMLGKAALDASPAEGEPGRAEALVIYNSKISMAAPIPLGSRTLALGGTLNYFSGHEYTAGLPEEGTSVDLFSQQVYSGQGQSLDLGAQFDLTDSLWLGITAWNVLGNFQWDESHSLVSLQSTEPRFQAGLAWDRPSFRAAFDWEWDQKKLRRYHLGLAKDFWKLFTIRVGGIIEPEKELVYTGGFSLRLGAFSVNFAANYQEPAWSGTVSMAINM